MMARFTAQGRLKPFLNNDGVSTGFEFKLGGGGCGGLRFVDGFSVPVQIQERKLSSCKSTSRMHASSSSVHKPKHLNKKSAEPSISKQEILEEIIMDDDPEFEEDELACFRGLVLDISYRPVNVVCWKRAICLEFMEKADVLEYYDQTVNSPNGSFYIPAVLRVPQLLQVVKRRRVKRNLSRKNVFQRDNYTCQYCSSKENLTVDHILPIARGGEWSWENLVTACSKCNSRKGHRTLEEASMELLKEAKEPKDFDIVAIPLTSTALKMLRMRQGTPEEWLQYLPMQ